MKSSHIMPARTNTKLQDKRKSLIKEIISNGFLQCYITQYLSLNRKRISSGTCFRSQRKGQGRKKSVGSNVTTILNQWTLVAVVNQTFHPRMETNPIFEALCCVQ